jgi:hypothetical protein
MRAAKDGHQWFCKVCLDLHTKKQLKTPKGKAKDRRKYLKFTYGITQEQYDDMLDEQNGGCFICDKITESNLHVDHCHTNGNIRGLLCSACNKGLGLFNDNPEFLRRAADYLEARRLT